MSHEADFVTRMLADSTLLAILTGGVFAYGALAGPDGITRDSAPTAFDGSGFLKPCAMVKQRSNVPDGNVRDGMIPLTSTIQIVEIYFYQARGYDQIDLAMARTYVLFEGYALPAAFPCELANVIDRQHDEGALKNASLCRQDWAVYGVMGA